jgi:hypothetical protein
MLLLLLLLLQDQLLRLPARPRPMLGVDRRAVRSKLKELATHAVLDGGAIMSMRERYLGASFFFKKNKRTKKQHTDQTTKQPISHTFLAAALAAPQELHSFCGMRRCFTTGSWMSPWTRWGCVPKNGSMIFEIGFT